MGIGKELPRSSLSVKGHVVCSIMQCSDSLVAFEIMKASAILVKIVNVWIFYFYNCFFILIVWDQKRVGLSYEVHATDTAQTPRLLAGHVGFSISHALALQEFEWHCTYGSA